MQKTRKQEAWNKVMWIFLIGLLFYQSHAYAPAQTKEFTIEEIPSWVEQIKEEKVSKVPDPETASGLYYLLLDSQIKKEADKIYYFTRVSKKVLNQNGIDNAALLEFEYDPLSESICLHQVSVKRGEQVIDHLNETKIKVLQREKDLERNLYNGIKSINIVLEDIRIGDIVTYSFTIESKNPTLNKSFYTKVYLSNYIPIRFMNKRLLWPKNSAPPAIKNHSTDFHPQVTQLEKHIEYVWQKKDVPLEKVEPYTPLWYDNQPWIEVGEDLKWYNINLTLSGHYKAPRTLPAALKTHVDHITSSEKKLEKRFILVMRFIQDEIRYMGMSDRIDRYQPVNLEDIFSKRFGDCKDKSYLAIAMLNALGIEAYAALVHTVNGRNIESRLPNPAAFNHVIVVALIEGKKYWIDPTCSFQGGTLKNYVQPDYDYALILDGKSQSPFKMPTIKLTEPTIEIYEKFDLSKGPGNPNYLSVKTVCKNMHADSQREFFNIKPRKELTEIYLNTMKKNYPNIRQKSELIVLDDREKNIIIVAEEYEIPDLWERKETKKRWDMYTYADELIAYVNNKNIFADRKTPVVVAFPRYITKKIEMILPDKWEFLPKSTTITDSTFEFKKETELKGLNYSIFYLYKSLGDQVDQKMVDSYIKNTDQAYALLRSTMCQFDPPPPDKISKNKDTLNWPIFLLLVIALIFFIYLAKKIYITQPKAPLERDTSSKLYGIEGWLVFPAFSVLISPFTILKDTFYLASKVLSHNTWVELSSSSSDSFNPLLLPVIFFEVTGNIGIIVFWVLTSLLLLQKKSLFPRMYVYVLMWNLLYGILDKILSYVAFSSVPTWRVIAIGLEPFIGALYMMKSKRVKKTFGQNYKFSSKQPTNESVEIMDVEK